MKKLIIVTMLLCVAGSAYAERRSPSLGAQELIRLGCTDKLDYGNWPIIKPGMNLTERVAFKFDPVME